MKFWVFISALLIFFSGRSFAADLPLFSLELSPAVFSDKLTQYSVNQTFQDSRGVLWLVTQEGLNKYSGHELETYQHSPLDSTSLPTNNINRIAEDRNGQVWLATRGAGLARYIPMSNSFKTLYSDPNNHNTPYLNDIITIFCDDEGILWLGYLNGISSFNPQDYTFHHYVSATKEIPLTGEVRGFTQTPDGAIWAATESSGLLKIDSSSGQITNILSVPGKDNSIADGSLYGLITDRSGKLWIASAQAGISIFDPVRGEAKNYRHSAEDLTSLSSNRTLEVYEDSHGDIWVATQEGLDLFLPQTSSFIRYTSNNTNMQEDVVLSIFQSREGKYWVGTMSGLASGMKTDFQKFNRSKGNLSNDSVNAFAETSDGSLWVGTDDGLNRLLPDASEFEWVNESTEPAISDPRVMSLYADADNLWVGTFEGGLNRINLETNEVKSYRHSSLDENTIGANGITSILRLSTGPLLIGTYGGGLSIYHADSDSFRNFSHDPLNPSSISDNAVLAIFEDSIGYIWIGTEKGLNKFDYERNQFKRYFSKRNNPDSLSSNTPWSFYEDSEGTLWIGTAGGGINLWDVKDRSESNFTLRHFAEKISLPSASVYGIQGDNDGWVWLSHNKGLTRIHPKTLEAHQYGIRDGLQDTEFTLGASFKAESGTIYFGGIRGFNTIHPELLNVDRIPPKVAISQIKIMNERREFEKPYFALESIDLSYEDKTFSVEFFAADYSNPELINYAYKLEGLNTDWMISKGSRVASFNTLPPGNYNLKLAAASPSGVWNWEGFNLPIHVAPPWWRSMWAYTVYGILAAATIFMLFYRQALQTRLALERQRELEQRVEERTIDLMEARQIAEEATKAKSNFLATMSHEIRTPMHGILGMTDLLLHTSLNSQQQQFASAAHNSGESLLTLINEILDFSKVEASKVELEEIEFSLTELLDDICYLQAEPAGRRGLTLNNICDPKTPHLLVGDPTKIRQVVMNLVSNSIKFTHEGNVNVRVTSKSNLSKPGQSLVHISVEDDGIGMDEETQKRVFEPFTQADTSTTREYGGTGLGLSISRNYIDLMGGDIVVQSEVGQGTKITLSLPLPHTQMDIPVLEQLTRYKSKILTTNPSSYEMISSHLKRLGISSSALRENELATQKKFENTILLVDYDSTVVSGELAEKLEQIETTAKIILVPLSTQKIPTFATSWLLLNKPITSSGLSDLLSEQLGISSEKPVSNSSGTKKFSQKKNILVAEDVPTNQKIIVEMIQLLGHEVEIAENGQEAVSKYMSKSFDSIFMDCQMPVMDGYEATRKIRDYEEENNTSPIHIIALTAGTSKEDQAKCKQAGMTGFLTKPFTMQDIENNIGRLKFDAADVRAPDPITAPVPNESFVEKKSSAPSARSEILNFSAIESIRDVERQTGRPILPSIFEGYIDQMKEKLNEIDTNVQARDSISIYKTAHAIKSMSANIGAKKITMISAQIEIEGKNNSLENMPDQLNSLNIAYTEFIREFETELAS